MKKFRNFTLCTLNFTLFFAAAIDGAAKASPLATQDWTRRTFYDAIQETGRTNVLTAADRQMISNYVDEVCRLYAGAPGGDVATNEVVFSGGMMLYTVGSTVQTNEVSFGFRAYTNAGMRVVSSTLPEVPAGTLYAYHGALARYVSAAATPAALDAAWLYSETTCVVARTSAAGTHLLTNVATRCFMKLSANDGGADWVSQQVESTWIVYKMVNGARAGSFTLVPHSLSDAQRDALVSPPATNYQLPAINFFSLFFPSAFASPYGEPPGSENAGDFFLSVKIDDLWYEVLLPTPRSFSGVGVVDSSGSYYSGDKIFTPSPWESLSDWCNPENRWEASISVSIPFRTPGGTIDYVQKTFSPKRLGNAFPELESRLAAMYVYPEEVKVAEPCSKEAGGHNWGSDDHGCVCRVCAERRDCVFGHLLNDTSMCQTCLNFHGPEYENGVPVQHEATDERCGCVSFDMEKHVGWRQGARITNDSGDVNYYLFQCTCQCGYFGQDTTNSHDFDPAAEAADWEAGEDESGTNADKYHHGMVHCRREAYGAQCNGVMLVKELHDCVKEDGSLTPGSRVFPVKDVGGVVTECDPDDPDASLAYHGQDGTCEKCGRHIENLAGHAPDQFNDCLCPCGMHIHSMPDEPDGCGNYRCRRCNTFLSAYYGEEEMHSGANMWDGDSVSHYCNCGRTSEPHEGYIKVASDGSKYCEACGYDFPLEAGGDNSVERYRVTYYPYIRSGTPQKSEASSVWSTAEDISSDNPTEGDLRGEIPPGITSQDLRKSGAYEAAQAILARGWTNTRYTYETRRYWFNLWVKTPLWTMTFGMENAQGRVVEFTYVYDLGLTFWEN